MVNAGIVWEIEREVVMSRIHQGGWVANFIIIGAVLVIGLLGGVYYLRQHNASQEQVATNTDETSTTSTNDTTRDDSANTPIEAPDTRSETTNPKAAEPEKNTAEQDTDTDELPTTGPSETAASLMAVTALSFSGASYLRSRRAYARLQ